MACTPYPRSCRRLSVAPLGQISLAACQTPTGATPVMWTPTAHHLHRIIPPLPSAFHVPHLPAIGRRLILLFSSPPSAPRLRCHCCCPPLPFRNQVFPVADHHIHCHIEDCGRQWVALSNASLSAEAFSVLTSRLHHHLQTLPIPMEEAEGPGPHTIFLQDFHSPGPFQENVCLVQVQEDSMDNRLPQGRNLLE